MAFLKALGSLSFSLALVALCSCSGGGFSSMCSGGHLSVSSHVFGTPPFDSVEIFMDGNAVDSSGTPCANATTGECQATYRAIATTKGARFVTTRGNEVTVRERVSYVNVGGTTDTPEEATLIVMGSSLETACTTFDTIEARAVGAGFEVATMQRSTVRETCTILTETVTPVDSTGSKSKVGA